MMCHEQIIVPNGIWSILLLMMLEDVVVINASQCHMKKGPQPLPWQVPSKTHKPHSLSYQSKTCQVGSTAAHLRYSFYDDSSFQPIPTHHCLWKAKTNGELAIYEFQGLGSDLHGAPGPGRSFSM